MDWTASTVQAILFSLFAALTAVLAAVLGPTYDNLLVPELAPAALYPSIGSGGAGGGSFLGLAAAFSAFLLTNLVDPAIALVGIAVGLLYLTRAVLGRWATRLEHLLPRLVVAVVLANFTLPIAGALLDLAGAAYPTIAGFDGGAWQHWTNLAGFGEVGFSWDNGALTFILTFALFSAVLLVAAAVALRDALLGVLLVLLPVFTLLGSVPPLAPLARRAWTMFGELAFLPCVLVVPLELAVGSPSVLLLLGYLTVALSTPSLVSLAGGQLSSGGFPSAGSALVGGLQRGLAAGSQAIHSYLRPTVRAPGAAAIAERGTTRAAALARGWGSAVRGAGATLGRAGLPAAIPLLAGEALGRGAAHLVRHLRRDATASAGPPRDRFPPVRPPRGR